MSRRAFFLLLAGLLIGAPPTAAVAQAVPTFDVGATCRAEATGQSSAYAQACMADENSARDTLVKGWATFAADAKARCLRIETGIPGVRSYVELLTCLRISKETKELPKQ
jgi:hypothetical protein